MDHSRHVLLSLTVLFCTCVAVALPVGQSQEFQGLLSRLFHNALTKNSQQSRDVTADTWPINNNDDSDAENSQPHDARPSSTSNKNIKALKQGFLGFNKRYGYYDYGLGGGRFGKRYYGDYGIGGGRFGRDVDHVDIGDANDAAQ